MSNERSNSVPAAASAATTTASPTAIAATSSPSAAATTTPWSTPTATAATLRNRSCFVYHQCAPEEILPIAGSDGPVGFGVVFKVDKTESARFAGEAVANKLHGVGGKAGPR